MVMCMGFMNREIIVQFVLLQVVTGGHYDVDVAIEAPNKQIIYKEVKKQYDTFPFVPEFEGVYAFCFSNEFSTFSHKLVYMDLQVGDEPPLPGVGEHITAMTQVLIQNAILFEDYNFNTYGTWCRAVW